MTVAWKRLKLELEPVTMFCAVFAGKALVDIAKQSWKALPKCFGTWQKGWNTIRSAFLRLVKRSAMGRAK